MKIDYPELLEISGQIKHFSVQSTCPECGSESGTDMGTVSLSEFPIDVGFYCPDCENHWRVRKLSLKFELDE